MNDPDTLSQEQRRLKSVLREIEAQIAEELEEVSNAKSAVTGTRRSISDELASVPRSFEELVELAGGMGRLRLAGKLHQFTLARLRQLERLARSAYFGRIDFRETGGQGRAAAISQQPRPIYIGVSSLTSKDTGQHLVFDWRAPISSVYYDFELGDAEYESPRGKVTGEVLLKRHFKIRGDKIELMYDNSLTIFDEILQETLGRATGDRMKAIVNTIQREQNRIIRDEGPSVLLVQGCAGSGKTAIALHRAAYLLYKHRGEMSAENIVMITPNRVFEDYTSPVLPELGEEPLRQVPFTDLAGDLLRAPGSTSCGGAPMDEVPTGKGPTGGASATGTPTPAAGTTVSSAPAAGTGVRMPPGAENEGEVSASSAQSVRLEEFADQLEYVLDFRNRPEHDHTRSEERPPQPAYAGAAGYGARIAGIKLKASGEFAAALRAYADNITRREFAFDGLSYRGKVLVSGSEVSSLISKEYSYLPMVKRVEKAKRRMMWILDEVQTERITELEAEIAADPENAHLFKRDIKERAAKQAYEELRPLRERVLSWAPLDYYGEYRRLFAEKGLLYKVLAAAGGRSSGGDSSQAALAVAGGSAPGGDPSRAALTAADGRLPSENSSPAAPAAPVDSPVLDAICRDTVERLDSAIIPHEDIAPILYLKGVLEGLREDHRIRHVIVDEAQDYSVLQFKVMRMAYPRASFTVLGDLNQTIGPIGRSPGHGGFEGAALGLDAGKDTQIVRLEKSYRSTREITEFTTAMLHGGQPVEPIERPGEKPLFVRSADRNALHKAIAADIRKLQEEGFRSIAVICRTARESWIAFEALRPLLKPVLKQAESSSRKSVVGGIRLVTKEQREFIHGTLVIPSYLAKGLEFEAVIIYNAGAGSYSHPDDRPVLYTACTRSLHRLHLHYVGDLSPLLADIYKSLYVRA